MDKVKAKLGWPQKKKKEGEEENSKQLKLNEDNQTEDSNKKEEISEGKEQQKEEEEEKGNQAKDDKLEGTENEEKVANGSGGGGSGSDSSSGKGGSSGEGSNEFKIYPKDFDITWGNDVKYWKPIPKEPPEAAAELLQVCWLQVTGSKKLGTGKSYEIKFKISLKDDAFGWNGLPVFMMAKIGAKGKYIWKKIKPLEQTKPNKPGEQFEIPSPEEKFIVEIPAGKGDEKQLFFGFYEIWSNKWKGGLVIHHAIVKEVSSPN